MAILEVQDIHTYYGDAYVLQGLSLKLEQGQILGLLGRNGVGKTTLVNSIVGFNPPRRGRIVFKGDDITADFVVRDHPPRHGTGPAGAPRVSDAERRGKPAGGRARAGTARLESATRLRPVSAPAGAAQSARQDAVGRRTADARDRPRADDQPRLPDHGRALGGACADHHPGRVGGDRQAEGGGPVDPAGRAERGARAQARRLCPRHQQGPGGLFREARRACGRTTKSNRAISESDSAITRGSSQV